MPRGKVRRENPSSAALLGGYQSAADLALVFEHVKLGLAIFDRDLRFLHVNERMADINGVPVAEHLGRTIWEVIPKVADMLDGILRPVLDEGRSIENIELVGETSAFPGVMRSWRAYYHPSRDANHEIVGALAVVRETTDEVRLENALADAASRLEMAMSGSGFGVWDWSVDTNSVWFSDTWQTMLGYEPGEVDQHISSWQKAVHPDDWPVINAALEPHLAGLTDHYECEHRVRCKDGRWLWILDRGKVVKRAPDGRALRVVGTHDNIQTRKEMERHLDARIKLSLDLADMEDVDQIIDCALLTIIETLDVDFAAYTESEGPDGIPRMARRRRSGRSRSSLGNWYGVRVKKDIARRLIRGEAVAVADLTAEASAFIGDVGGPIEGDDLKALLVVPIRSFDRLVGTFLAGDTKAKDWTPQQITFLSDVRDRAREAIARAKAGEANRQAQLELQRVERRNTLAALASTLAHELNQPLAAATNYLSVARMQVTRLQADHPVFGATGSEVPGPAKAIELAIAQVTKAGDIIRQMRAFTESGEVMSRLGSLKDTVEAALQTTLAGMLPRGLSIRKHYEDDLPNVLIDSVQLQQVVSNLVRNAIEAMDGQDKAELDISVTRDGKQLVADVCDNGPGLSDAVLATLFQPFRSTKRRGLGLGLPICRTIIEAHGGTLTGEQRAEGGARFRIRLPLRDAPPRR